MQRLIHPMLVKHKLEHLPVITREVNIDAFAQIIRQLLEIAPVGEGQDQFHDPAAPRGDNFFANAAHRQHLPGQRQFAGHRQRTLDALATRQRQAMDKNP